MLDPVTALNVAANIVQFVQLGVEIFSKSNTLYKSASGKSAEDAELESLAENLESLTQYATQPLRAGDPSECSTAELQLVALAKECMNVSARLRKLISSISIEEEGSLPTNNNAQRRWNAFRATLQRMRKSGEIDNISKTLDKLGRRLSACLLAIFNDKSDRQTSLLCSLKEMCETNHTWQARTMEDMNAINENSAAITGQLKRLANTTDSLRRSMEDEQKSRSIWFQGGNSKLQDLRETVAKVNQWIERSEKATFEQQLLQSLAYDRMEERHAQIAEAHVRTFKWIFGQVDPDTQLLADNSFTTWLRSENGTFWVSGKAGSGKSTLMKYICTHPQTMASLQQWAGEDVLVTASFFFWNNGTEMQKSHEGLLRSLLFRVFAQFPCLISICLPTQWSACKDGKQFHLPWTKPELLNALRLLTHQTKVQARFCFFVDGLDEYSGDHEELIALLGDITKTSRNFKICVSSRPWNVFQTAFRAESYRRIFMDQLTQDDIRLYVNDTLAKNKLYRRLLQREENCDDFVAEIVKRANGVFLWVFLVVKSLLAGLKNEDRLSTLHSRLCSLPTDLDHYFQHMLDNIEDVYQQQAAESFLLALNAREPLSLLTFSFLDEDEPRGALTSEPSPMKPIELCARYKTMRTRMNARCKDLLEVTSTGKPTSPGFQNAMNGLSQLGNLRPEDFFAYRVDFLHRTVRDFLKSSRIRQQITSRLAANFQPDISLCLALLAQLKAIPIKRDNLLGYQPFPSLIDDLAYHARLLERDGSPSADQLEVLDELARTFHYFEQTHKTRAEVLTSTFALNTSRSLKAGDLAQDPKTANSAFLIYAARHGLRTYVMGALAEHPPRKQLISLIRCVLAAGEGVRDSEMIRLLLVRKPHGLRPISWEPVFSEFLTDVAIQWPMISQSQRLDQIATIRTFQQSGELRSTTAPYHCSTTPSSTSLAWVDLLLMCPQLWTEHPLQTIQLAADAIEWFLKPSDSTNATDPNLTYKGSTLWGHFLHNLPAHAPRNTKARLLCTIQTFLDRGADRSLRLPLPTEEIGLSMMLGLQQSSESVKERLGKLYTHVDLMRVGLYKEEVQADPASRSSQDSTPEEPEAPSESQSESWISWLSSWTRR